MAFSLGKSENSCRICLSSTEWDLVALFSYEEGANHANKLSYCAGVEIHEGDMLPQKICSECLQSVEAACKIKEKCIATDQLLRRHLKPDLFSQQDKHQEMTTVFEFNGGVGIKVEPDWSMNFDPQIPDYTDEAPTKKEPSLSDDNDWADPADDFDDAIPDETIPATSREQKRASTSQKTKTKAKGQPKLEVDKPKYPKPRPEDFMCLLCNKVFPKIIEKTRHLQKDHADELECKICKKKRGTIVAAENCMRDHLYGYKFLCQVCALPFRKKGHLDDHIRGVHTQKADSEMFACDLCGTKLKYKANMQRHMRTGKNQLPVHMKHKIPCPHKDTCPNVFYTTVNSLNNHLYRNHNVAAPVNCQQCHLGFTNASELKAHLKRVCTGNPSNPKRRQKLSLKQFYTEADGQFHCKICQKVIATKKYYQDHYQNYHRDNKTCTICNRTFASFVSYRRHKKSVHDKIKDFFCDFPGCGKAFSMKSGQLAHRKTHLKH